jgi:DNA-directed RNA polymerase subunit RPC12/RpoP
MKNDDLFAELKPARKAPQKLMHVLDVDGSCCCDESPSPVKYKCPRCGHETDWIEPRTVTEAKRGIPCPVCNAKPEQKAEAPVCEISQTGVGEWCAPGPANTQARNWLLMFDDQDRGFSVFEDEQEARNAFAKAESSGWNCHLFQHAPR